MRKEYTWQSAPSLLLYYCFLLLSISRSSSGIYWPTYTCVFCSFIHSISKRFKNNEEKQQREIILKKINSDEKNETNKIFAVVKAERQEMCTQNFRLSTSTCLTIQVVCSVDGYARDDRSFILFHVSEYATSIKDSFHSSVNEMLFCCFFLLT